MGNCTQPSQSSDAEQCTIPMGSFAKNSFLKRSQSEQAKNDLSSGMFVNVFIYSKIEGLSQPFNRASNPLTSTNLSL